MHLIDTSTLKLTWFPGAPPPYAVLSHTWGLEEVTFADFSDLSKIETKAGFNKIKQTCKQALKDGFSYAWVDTCCINKDSSSELSEAINCMFRWYRDAALCYAYLEDLPEDITLPIASPSLVKNCRWFTRGWTLQELLAPRDMVFFGPKWTTIGRKTELTGVLEEITGIPCAVLTGDKRLNEVSVADRMNWAARRQTTREEDIAYCLMGVFDVNMPMMYGEGRKAFLRLQEEILKQTQDDSLFAWRASEQSASEAPYRGLFASSPKEFASEVSITPFSTSMASVSTMLGNGRISLSCALYEGGVFGLKCFRGTDVSLLVGISVTNTASNQFLRSNPSELVLKPHQYPATFRDMVFEKFAEMREPNLLEDIYRRDGVHLVTLPPEISVTAVYPEKYKDWEMTSMVPTVTLIGNKIAFDLTVDRKASGVDVFQYIGWGEDDEFVKNEDMRILLILWVERQTDSNSYAYYFDLKAAKSQDAESKFAQAITPSEALGKREVAIGWSTLGVRGRQTRVDGYQMFGLELSFSISEDIKTEAETISARLQEEKETNRTRERVRKRKRKQRLWVSVSGSLLLAALCLMSGAIVLYKRVESTGTTVFLVSGASFSVAFFFWFVCIVCDVLKTNRRDIGNYIRLAS
jgi:hypothetical protein